MVKKFALKMWAFKEKKWEAIFSNIMKKH